MTPQDERLCVLSALPLECQRDDDGLKGLMGPKRSFYQLTETATDPAKSDQPTANVAYATSFPDRWFIEGISRS